MKAIRARPPADIHEARAVLDRAFGEFKPPSDVTVFEIDAGDSSITRLVIEVPEGAVVALDHLVLSVPE